MLATAEVEREVSVTREVPVTVEIERTVLATVEIPVTVEVPYRVEVSHGVDALVPYRILPNEEGKDACVKFNEFRTDRMGTFEEFVDFLMAEISGSPDIRPVILQDVFLSAIRAHRVYWEAGEDAGQDESEQVNRSLDIADFYCNEVVELDCDRWLRDGYSVLPNFCR